jgi:predicted DCC family thiol-disulfide oxidoreductase YuxK
MPEITDKIIIFDGECAVCNSFTGFLINTDKKGLFQYWPRESEAAKNLLQSLDFPANIDSIIFYDCGKTFIKSEAVINILSQLNWKWKLVKLLKLLPLPLRDLMYDHFARRRHYFSANPNYCPLPHKK